MDGEGSTRRRRFPGWVYDVGQEADTSFSLSNERTFLSGARTGLALAGAVLAGLVARSAGRRLSGVRGVHPSLVDEAATRTVSESPGGHLVTVCAALLLLVGLAAVTVVLR